MQIHQRYRPAFLNGGNQGLTLVHFWAQSEPSLVTEKRHDNTQRIEQTVLTSRRKLDECETLVGKYDSGHNATARHVM